MVFGRSFAVTPVSGRLPRSEWIEAARPSVAVYMKWPTGTTKRAEVKGLASHTQVSFPIVHFSSALITKTLLAVASTPPIGHVPKERHVSISTSSVLVRRQLQ